MKKNKIFFFALQFAFALNCASQNTEQLKVYGTTYDEYAYGIVSDSVGNNYTIGTYQGTFNFGNGISIQSNKGFFDIFLVKRDSLGQVIWAKSFGSNDTNYSHAFYMDDVIDIAIDKECNIYVLGEVNCSADIIFGNIVIPNNQTPDMKNVFISKFDSNGICKWVTINKTNPNAKPNKIAVDSKKRVSITGGAYGGEKFGNFTLSHSGTYIATLDSTGNVIWAKAYYGIISDLVYDKNNYLYCTGTINNTKFDNTTITLKGLSDFFIAKIDSVGNLKWVKNEGGTDANNGFAIGSSENNLYVLGKYESPISFDAFSLTGNNKIFLVSYNNLGIVQWANKIEANPWWCDNNNTDLILNKQQEIFVLFHSSGSFSIGESTISADGVESIIAKYTSNGLPSWAIQSHTSNGGIQTKKICSDNLNHLYMTGTFKGQISISNLTTVSSVNNTYNDIFYSSINTKNTTTEINYPNVTNNFFVYPNPTSDKFTLKSNSSLINSIYYIVDQQGKTVLTGKITLENSSINISKLPKGLYLLNVDNHDNIGLKFVKK